MLIPEHNRVVYVSVCSFIWTSFLAYMKALQAQREQQEMAIDSTNKKELLENTNNAKSTIRSIEKSKSNSL